MTLLIEQEIREAIENYLLPNISPELRTTEWESNFDRLVFFDLLNILSMTLRRLQQFMQHEEASKGVFVLDQEGAIYLGEELILSAEDHEQEIKACLGRCDEGVLEWMVKVAHDFEKAIPDATTSPLEGGKIQVRMASKRVVRKIYNWWKPDN